ncbi:MAG: hypothetical protein E7015_00515 [Alphaproteobacteria bacterium]|nr:hypothetical protein [Alphaproteobacteria bacterium]
MVDQTKQSLVARICHDLITPFNAINLGLEAYEMSKDASLLSCIKESVEKANTILKFMRELYSSKDDGYCYSSKFLESLLSDFSTLYNINFSLIAPESVPYIEGKIMLYDAVMLKELMPFGGSASCYYEDHNLTLKYSGQKISALSYDSLEQLNHRNILKHELLDWLKLHNYSVQSQINGETAELTITQ